MAELACVDGRVMPAGEATIPATDEGLLRGDGVFEVIRVYDGRPFALRDHLDRIERSAANLRLDDVPRSELESEIPALLEERGGAAFDGCLRIVLTRGGHRLLLTEPLPRVARADPARRGQYAPTHVLDGIKSLSYGANMLCSRLARERGFDEALLVTPQGSVLEAPTSSLFWVDEFGTILTPPLERAHPRLDHARPRDARGRRGGAALHRWTTCARRGEAFLASTTREAQSIAAIEGLEFPERRARARPRASRARRGSCRRRRARAGRLTDADVPGDVAGAPQARLRLLIGPS